MSCSCPVGLEFDGDDDSNCVEGENGTGHNYLHGVKRQLSLLCDWRTCAILLSSFLVYYFQLRLIVPKCLSWMVSDMWVML